jgi:uncharacterized protein (TIGR03067 family)
MRLPRFTMRGVALVVMASSTVFCTALVRAGAPDDKPRTDQEQILGTWEVASSEEGGKDVGESFRGMKVVFTKDRLKLMPKDETEAALQMDYKLDPQKKPKQIDTTHELDPGKPISQLGIYELDVDKLKICLEAAGRGRPDKFETKANGSAHLMILKRIKK